MKRTVEQMDEKDWIIVRLASLLVNALGANEAMALSDYNRTCAWLFTNLTMMEDLVMLDFYCEALEAVHCEQGFTIAGWPYAVIEEPLPPECQLVESET